MVTPLVVLPINIKPRLLVANVPVPVIVMLPLPVLKRLPTVEPLPQKFKNTPAEYVAPLTPPCPSRVMLPAAPASIVRPSRAAMPSDSPDQIDVDLPRTVMLPPPE